MIMFALVWWCYPIVTACVAVPMAFFWLIENRRDAREAREDGPFPCLAYLGRDVEVGELWCWLLYGHDGEHEDQSELPDTAFTKELPDDTECFCGADHSLSDFSFDHMRQTDAAGNVVIDESPDYLPGTTPLPALPQRLSKVPTQTEHNDPWPQCGQRILFTGGMTCTLAKGHPGPHAHH